MSRFLLLAISTALLTTAQAGTNDAFGIWSFYRGVHDPAQLKQKCPWLKGTIVQLK